MDKITFRKIYDNKGDYSHIELVQGENTIRLYTTPATSTPTGAKWQEIRTTMDNLVEDIKQEAQRKIGK